MLRHTSHLCKHVVPNQIPGASIGNKREGQAPCYESTTGIQQSKSAYTDVICRVVVAAQ